MRRKNEEVSNPFAKGAPRPTRKVPPKANPQPKKQSPPQPPLSAKATADKKRKEALAKMKNQSNQSASGPAKAGGGDRGAKTTANVSDRKKEIKQETRSDRLAELSRQKRVMGGETEIKPGVVKKQHESSIKPSEEAIASVQPKAEPVNVFAPKAKGAKPKAGAPPRRFNRRREKKGGGRQPQVKKLDRRKYLEYKYVVRDLLDDDSIAEENRSNVLGQVWAKGERISVEAAIEFIDEKQAELIIPKSAADELRSLVKRYTTKR
ncbi:MAG: hypothetical protein ACKVHH_01255 [Candidatus Poseidoniales archaeon]